MHKYALPPFEVAHQGRVFCTSTVEKNCDDEVNLKELNKTVLNSLGLKKGVSHTEYIKSAEGKFYFLETSARVGGANIGELITFSSGVNLWKEWAIMENLNENENYTLPEIKGSYGAIIISLAKQENPDLSSYDDKSIVWKLDKKYHAGLILVNSKYDELIKLSDEYISRFYSDFFTSHQFRIKL